MKVKRVDPPVVEKVDAVRQSEKVGVGAVKGATKPTKGKQRKKKAEKVGKDKGKLIITDGVGKKAAAKGSGKGVEKTIEVKRSTSGDYSNGEARWQGLPELRVTDLPEEAQESIRTTLNAVDQQSKNSGRKYKGEISAAQSYTNLVKGELDPKTRRFDHRQHRHVSVCENEFGLVEKQTAEFSRPRAEEVSHMFLCCVFHFTFTGDDQWSR